MRQVLLTLALVGGCGGAQGAGTGAQEPSTADSASHGPGAACLEDAATPREVPADAPESIEVAHILVRHAELERPEGATRSREAACLRALAAREKLEHGAEWEATVAEFSDAPGATEGNLGVVSRDELAPEFANAAFSLEVNQLSYVVETDRGFHVIVRLE